MNEELLILRELKDGNKNLEWVSKNYPTLQKDYSNNFVAIKNREIFFAKPKLEELIESLTKKHKNPEDYLIKFIYAKGDTLVV